MLDVLQTQRRYNVFDKNTFKHFLKVCDSLTTYKLEKPVTKKSTDIFVLALTVVQLQGKLSCRSAIRKRRHGLSAVC